MAGGVVRALVDRKRKGSASEAEFSPGVLMSSGFIAGAAIVGVVLGVLTGLEVDRGIDFSGYLGHLAEADWFAMIPFFILMFVLYRVGLSKTNNKKA